MALLSHSSDLQCLWDVWDAPTVQHSTRAIIATLHTFTTLLATPLPTSSAASAAVASFGKALLESHLKPVYFQLSGDDHTKANRALALLTAAVSLSSEHALLFLRRFDLSLSSLPKLAAPQHVKRSAAQADSAASRWRSGKLAKRPSRACFVDLALACLAAVEHGTDVAVILAAPNLLGLVLNNVAKDPPHVQLRVCAALLHSALAEGERCCVSRPLPRLC